MPDEPIDPLTNPLYLAGWAACRRASVFLLLEQAKATGSALPDAHGGNFAKKFAANALLGAAALLRKLEPHLLSANEKEIH